MEIAVGDLTFSVRVDGAADAPAVLLLHGFPQSSLSWSRVSPQLTAAGLRTIAPDQRGYAPGARPAAVSAYTMTELVGDAVGLLDALELSSVDVMGHDWGAMVGWHVAGRHPERVRSLVAVSVPHPLAMSAAMASDPDQQQRSAYIHAFRQPGGAAEEMLLADGARRLRRIFAGSGLSEAEIAEYVEPLREPGALTAALCWYRAMSRADTPLGPVSVPTTFVWSDHDVAIGRTAAEACEQHVSGRYRFIELPGVSHWVPEQAPDALVDAVLAQVSAS